MDYNMDYYKKIYSNLKKQYKINQIGGLRPPISDIDFLRTHFSNFRESSLYDYAFSYLRDLESFDTASEESKTCVITYLTKFCNIVWEQITPQSKTKDTIIIFSFGPGKAFMEAFIGNYIRREHHKDVSLVFMEHDSTLNKEIIEAYETFCIYINFLEI